MAHEILIVNVSPGIRRPMSRGPRDIITASRDREGAVMTSSDGDQLSYLDKSDMDRIYSVIVLTNQRTSL